MSIAQIIKAILNAGTQHCERKEDAKRIRIINCLCLITALAAFSIGNLLYAFTLDLKIEIPAMCEGLLFSLVIFFNWKQQHNIASLVFLLSHTVSALYFGIIL